MHLYAKDPFYEKYYLLNKIRQSVDFKHCNDPKAFIEYSNGLDDLYENIDEYNPKKNNAKNLLYFII